MHLCVLYRHVEAMDQIERVVAREAREIHVLREHEHEQHDDPAGRLTAPQGVRRVPQLFRRAQPRETMMFIPAPDVPEDGAREQTEERERSEARLSPTDDDDRRHEWAKRGTRVATD